MWLIQIPFMQPVFFPLSQQSPFHINLKFSLFEIFWKFPKTCLFRSSGWLNDNRDSLVKKLGTNAVAEVAKAAGVAWKKLSAAKKKPYEKVAGFWAGHVVGEDDMCNLKKFPPPKKKDSWNIHQVPAKY